MACETGREAVTWSDSPVTVLSDDTRQTDALSGFLIAAHSHRVLGLALALLATERRQIPVSLFAPLAFGRCDSSFALTNTGYGVALLLFRSFGALAVFASAPRREIPVPRSAFVTFQPDHVRLADALSGSLVTPATAKHREMMDQKGWDKIGESIQLSQRR